MVSLNSGLFHFCICLLEDMELGKWVERNRLDHRRMEMERQWRIKRRAREREKKKNGAGPVCLLPEGQIVTACRVSKSSENKTFP